MLQYKWTQKSGEDISLSSLPPSPFEMRAQVIKNKNAKFKSHVVNKNSIQTHLPTPTIINLFLSVENFNKST